MKKSNFLNSVPVGTEREQANFMKIHFIGIGGIGVSALARHHLQNGEQVSGSDLSDSELILALKNSGVQITVGPSSADNLPEDIDKVIYSPAVKKGNPEFDAAIAMQGKNPNLEILSYPQALGQLVRDHFTIAVCGTHGKSTTTSMIGLMLMAAGYDPTIVVGTKLKELGNSNYRKGASKYLVIEACEHEASFLNYWPKIIVLTNIEADHLDYYKNLENIFKSFREFIGHLPSDGLLIANADDANTEKVLASQNNNFKISKYSLSQPEAEELKKILKVPGEHNISNALSALSVARAIGIDDAKAFESLSYFSGTWRRFDIEEKKTGDKNITLISDYAHHPTEIRATLKAGREKYPQKDIVCAFQPHQYQRTHLLFDDFVKTFQEALANGWINKLLVTDIYDVAGREDENIKKMVSAEKLVNAMENDNAVYAKKENLKEKTIASIKNGSVLIIMGAGSIYGLKDQL